MTADQILLGVGLTLVLAVGCQIVAARFRFPAIVVLLPVGFVAGALTDDINPVRVLGPAFTPLVSLAVALILYDAGLALDLKRLRGHTGRVVVRLLWLGVGVTWAFATAFGELLFGLSRGAAVMLGTILVVSGPTVVGPLLGFVRPVERLQHILAWEGSLIDPVGGILGALVFHAVLTGPHGSPLGRILGFLASVSVGLAGGAVGTAVLWLLLGRMRLAETLATSAQLAVVVGVAAVCDVLHDDSGLIAAVAIGVAVANLPGLDAPAGNPFLETLVQQILGVLFIAIPATITPSSLKDLVVPALGLLAVLVLLVRPLVALVSTLGTDLSSGERAFVGWMAPRGIVAASTASTFSASLAAAGVPKAAEILPITFLVIVGTVTLYAFTAAPLAARLKVRRHAWSRPLLVGGDAWVIDVARAFRTVGIDVLMWAGVEHQREQIRQAGLELAPGELLAAATGAGAELEGITAVLLLTAEDDFNALASTVLHGNGESPVYRLGPPDRRHGLVAPYTGGQILFATALTRIEIDRRHRDGAPIVTRPAAADVPAGHDILFRIRANGALAPVTESAVPPYEEGDVEVLLGPAPTPPAAAG
ncbi:cation:proton antiporter [Kitasatospora cinereorecta]|uniref:Cation:proton antiporter n=1 Tax=Kitasatospora cinereorecta TaxID=285560 RepID=A0ABW0V351_9ACTN